MRIAILTDAWTPIWGGGQAHIWEIYTRLAKSGFEVDVLVPNLISAEGKTFPKIQSYGKLRIIRLGPKFIFPNLIGRLAFVFACVVFTLSHSYDLYHSHSPSTSLCLPLLKLVGRKVAYTVHGKAQSGLGAGIFNKLGPFLNSLIVYKMPYDILFSAAASSIEEKPSAKKPIIIGNGVNTSEFSTVNTAIKGNYFTILCVARRDRVKGISFLENAVKMIQEKYPHVKLHLVTGRKRTASDFSKANLYVLPSLSEGLPLVILEAMAAGLPIVATAVGDVPRLVNAAGAGIIVPPGDVLALKGAIEKMISLGPKIKKIGENGKKYVQSEYTWDKVANNLSRAYTS